jgi:Spy/CpxP family protein refolding chaperone
MLKKVLGGMLLITMISLADYAAGQDMPSGKWWYNSQVVQHLNLTKPEIRQLDKLYVNSHRRLLKLKNDVEREQFELDNLLGSKKKNDAEVKKQFERLEQARTNLANERLKFVIRVREIIGPERFQQLKMSYKKWR